MTSWRDAIGRAAHDRRVLGVLLLAWVAIAARELTWSSLFHADQRLIDFRVFWCGGQVALQGANPYLFEPLRTCEHQYGAGLFSVSRNFVMPFVLPPFDIAPFAQLARMAYGTAAWFFTGVSAVALLAGIVLVARSTGAPLVLAASALLVSVGLPSLWLGQLVPLELLFLSAAAYALARRRDAVAGACAVLSLLEPHVGAFVVVSVALLVPRARAVLAGGLALLASLTVRDANVAPLGLYLATLAEHTRAEAGSYGQYSLTFVLRYLHAPLDFAVAAGAASSLVLLVAAVVLARALDARGMRAAIVYIPTACAVFGGTFVHLTQIALAVPAALLVHACARNTLARRLAGLAAIVLSAPWPIAASNKQTLAAALFAVAVTTWYTTGRRYRGTLAAVALTWLALVPLQNTADVVPPIPTVAVAAPSSLASTAWKDALDQMTVDSPRSFWLKVPTWIALCALLGAALVVMRREPLTPRPPPWRPPESPRPAAVAP